MEYVKDTLMKLKSISLGFIAVSLSLTTQAATLSTKPYGKTEKGLDVTEYTMTNKNGVSVSFINYGGIITNITTPDQQGNKTNIVLGFDNIKGYEADGAKIGTLVGRFANRIGNAEFTIDGKTYPLEKNNGPNTLHGGSNGYDKRIWNVKPLITQGNNVKALLSLTSPNGDQGFPGTLNLNVTYSLSDDADNTFRIDYEAKTDQPTVLNLTNHSYFNLSGVKNSPYGILDHVVTLNADHVLETDQNSLPTGVIRPVANTAFDFKEPKAIFKDIRQNDQQLAYGYGYDQTWVINTAKNSLRMAAFVVDPKSKRTLTIETTEPGIQMYTANHLNGTVLGAEGVLYRQADGLALETQHFPDSPNQPNFPSTRLDPKQTFNSTTILKFGVQK